MIRRSLLLLALMVPAFATEPPAKPKPRLSSRPSGALKDQLGKARNLGVVGIDAKWSEFGAYLQSFLAGVHERWFAAIEKQRVAPRAGTMVAITFKLCAAGSVVVEKSEGATDKPAIEACVAALTVAQPGLKWTDAMVKKLGLEQRMTVQFYYQ